MKESYSEDIMLCFLQGFGEGDGYKSKEINGKVETVIRDKKSHRKLSRSTSSQVVELRKKSQGLVTGKDLKLSSSSGDRLAQLPEVKRSLSDRFGVITDGNARRPARGLLTIRKTW